MLSVLFFYGGASVFLLRIALGVVMIVHGWSKLKDLKKTAEGFNGMGFRPGSVWGTYAGLLEFFGGIAIFLGVFVLPVSFLFMGEFAVIVIWKLARRMPLVGGYELDLVILAGFIVLFALGGGAWSLDRTILGMMY